jgi:hypothetical protein
VDSAPCRGCPDREAECQVSCQRWQAYVEIRNASYDARRTMAIAGAPSEHWSEYERRIAKWSRQGRRGPK